MLIKVCGMRNAKNIEDVCRLGVNYIGLIFYEKSPRFVEAKASYPTDIEVIIKATAKRVGVFVNADENFISERVLKYNLDCVQLHGNETVEFCKKLRKMPAMNNKQIFKAINIGTTDDLQQCTDYEGVVDMFVFDTKSKLAGGNGTQFDWNVLDLYNGNTPYLLSGGIGPDDTWRVSAFVNTHKRCAGIDLNSRFETSPAVKNIEILKQFITELKNE